MMKTANEMQFQQNAQNLLKQLEIFNQKISNKTTQQKIISSYNERFNQLKTKIKNLKNILSKIETQSKFNMKSKNINQSDVRQKLRKYQTAKQKIIAKYENIEKTMQNININFLIYHKKNANRDSQPGANEIQLRNINLTQQLLDRYNAAGRDINEVNQITSAWRPQLENQGNVIASMGVDVRQAEAQLSMGDQLMRIIRNRSLITKLLLIVLIIFMGLADILLLVVKVI